METKEQNTVDLVAQMAEDVVGSFPVPNDTDLALVSSLVQRQKKLENDLALYEELVEGTKKNLTEVREKFLPEALARFGLLEIVMLDGSRVTIKPDTFVSIPEKSRKDAYDWLRQHGFGNIIEEEISVPLAKGAEQGTVVVEYLKQNGFSFEMSQSIHYQTLKAWAKEQLERGTQLPQDLFSVFTKKIAKIK